jgi:hypothetical protein
MRAVLVTVVLALVSAVADTAAVRAQNRPPDPRARARQVQLDEEDLTILNFLQAVETAISTMDRQRWGDLLSPGADRDASLEFFDAMVARGITRAVIKERDRSALPGALPGEGYRLVVEVFIETGARGRIATWRLDIRRPRGEDLGSQPWRILAEDRLAAIEGLHRLSLNPERQYAARNLLLQAVDFELRLPQGDVFAAETAEGVTALVLLGDGTMIFRPGPKEERGQLRIFSGGDALETPFTAAFVRLNPFEFEQRVGADMLAAVDQDVRTFRRAQAVFDDDLSKSFSLDLSDLSRDAWSLLPQPGDFVAEVRTRRYDTLTYTRSSGQPEDVSLFQRARKRNIAVYASEQKLASRGRFYNEDDLVDYDILDYNVDVALQPARDWIDGRVRLRLRVTSYAMAALTLHLAESLTVTSVASDELGRLLFLRVRNQNSIVINLPTPVARDYQLTLTITYTGRVPQQGIQDESVTLQEPTRGPQPEDFMTIAPEPKWLYSTRSFWYPQGQVTDYATATIRASVPAGYNVVGSGVAAPGFPMPMAGAAPDEPREVFLFTAAQPVRYLSLLVSRMNRVDAATVAVDIVPPAEPLKPQPRSAARTLSEQIANLQAGGESAAKTVPPIGSRNTLALALDAVRRQEGRARDATMTVAEILRLYAATIGDVPYGTMTVAMVEDMLPGGHAPSYFAMINNPPPGSLNTWRADPASFQNFPEFFIAHELAHQWFGQAVGWKNYHEQWLSEGFAQYFAALYARERRGDQAFRDILRQFRRWSLEESDQGAVYLGYRLGHIKGEPRVFRAVVYNKGAAVLHMLRRLMGDDAFFKGVRRFYAENRYRKAGTDDLRRAMEAESGRKLERFFERWIYDSSVPRLRMFSMLEGQQVVVRFEQGEVFDVPITVTLTYTDGRTADHLVLVTDASTEARLPLTGTLRSVDANLDGGAVAIVDRK